MADPVNQGAPQGGTGGNTGNPPPAGGAGGDLHIDAELSTWGKNKGIADFDTMAKSSPDFYKLATSYRETEKFLGGDKIPLPKDMTDAGAMRSVFQKLGAPAEAKDYKVEGASPEFAEWARTTFHEANMTQTQADKMSSAYTEYQKGLIAKDDNDRAERALADKVGLEKDWGPNLTANIDMAERARNLLSSDLGISRDALNEGLEEAFGLRDAMRILHFLSTKSQMTNDNFEGDTPAGGRGGTIPMTADQAAAEKQKLLADREFAVRHKNGEASAKQQLAELNDIIASAGGAQRLKVSQGNPGRR